VGGSPNSSVDEEGLLGLTTVYGVRRDMSLSDAVRAGAPGRLAVSTASVAVIGGAAGAAALFCPGPPALKAEVASEVLMAIILASGAGNGGVPDPDRWKGDPSRNGPRERFSQNGGGVPPLNIPGSRRRGSKP
jgi:hypothetical protein